MPRAAGKVRRESDVDVGWSGRWVTPIAPRAGRGDARARGEEGFARRAMPARTSLDPAAPSEESTAWSRTRRISGDASASSPVGGMGWRFRVTSHPRASGCCFLARPSVATAGGVDRGDRRDRRDPFGGRNPVDRASPGYRPRRTAGERVAGRGAPPGEFGNRALRAEKDRFRARSSQRREPRFYRFSRRSLAPNGANAIRSSLPTVAGSRGKSGRYTMGSMVGGGGTPRRPTLARRTRRRPVRRCRARAAMARLRRVPRLRKTRSRGR